MLKLSWCTIHIPSGTVIDVAFQYGMDETLQGQIKYSFLLIIISHHQSKICSSETVEFLHPGAAREKYASTENYFNFLICSFAFE